MRRLSPLLLLLCTGLLRVLGTQDRQFCPRRGYRLSGHLLRHTLPAQSLRSISGRPVGPPLSHRGPRTAVRFNPAPQGRHALRKSADNLSFYCAIRSSSLDAGAGAVDHSSRRPLLTAAFLTWGAASAQLAGNSHCCSTCLLLLNCEVVFATGNTAGIVVSLSVIAVWCFLRERFPPLEFCASLSPLPSSLTMLDFYGSSSCSRAAFIASARCRLSRSLAALIVGWLLHGSHTLRLTGSARCAQIWQQSPVQRRPQPARSPLTNRPHAVMVIDLQAVTSAIWSDPHLYNLASYLVCGILICLWAFTTIRSTFLVSNAWLAVAAAVPLTILITYHRPYDAKLLLLTIPACALLWAEGGLKRGWQSCLHCRHYLRGRFFPGCARRTSPGIWIIPACHLHIVPSSALSCSPYHSFSSPLQSSTCPSTCGGREDEETQSITAPSRRHTPEHPPA